MIPGSVWLNRRHCVMVVNAPICVKQFCLHHIIRSINTFFFNLRWGIWRALMLTRLYLCVDWVNTPRWQSMFTRVYSCMEWVNTPRWQSMFTRVYSCMEWVNTPRWQSMFTRIYLCMEWVNTPRWQSICNVFLYLDSGQFVASTYLLVCNWLINNLSCICN